MTSKVVFQDFDGTLVPFRSEIMHALGTLFRDTGAKLVLSTAWAWTNDKDPDGCFAHATGPLGDLKQFLHVDWRCARFKASLAPDAGRTARRLEVAEWLGRHPETTHWVAFDDAPVDPPGGIICQGGMTPEHVEKALDLLVGDRMPPLPRMSVDYGPFPAEPNIRHFAGPSTS